MLALLSSRKDDNTFLSSSIPKCKSPSRIIVSPFPACLGYPIHKQLSFCQPFSRVLPVCLHPQSVIRSFCHYSRNKINFCLETLKGLFSQNYVNSFEEDLHFVLSSTSRICHLFMSVSRHLSDGDHIR